MLRSVPAVVSYEGADDALLSPDLVRDRADAMLEALGLEARELSILLCDDARIQVLNREYRQRDRPTDVLSFSMAEGEQVAAVESLLGDVVISLPTAARQAAERERDTLLEVTELLAHGLLHILGFDHQSDDEERRMRARTDMLVAAAQASRGPTRAAAGPPSGDKE
ncbi:MAG: rRNA maturation RNase YbeY [Myxococcales bacterium]|nr:rRNA maturation RNase YbeY [Myxococcales bacterium]